MRRERWFYAARCRCGCLFYRRNVPRQFTSTCLTIWRLRGSLIVLQHEVLAAVASGRHVVLCGHTNTERGYLSTLAEKLRAELSDTNFSGEGVEVHVSDKDRHPLDIV